MTIGEIIEELKTTDNYLSTRLKFDDQTIEFIKLQFPKEYDKFKIKEESFVFVIKALNNGNTFN